MLLYRMNKLVEDQARMQGGFVDQDGDLAEFRRVRQGMQSSASGLPEVEDLSEWITESVY